MRQIKALTKKIKKLEQADEDQNEQMKLREQEFDTELMKKYDQIDKVEQDLQRAHDSKLRAQQVFEERKFQIAEAVREKEQNLFDVNQGLVFLQNEEKYLQNKIKMQEAELAELGKLKSERFQKQKESLKELYEGGNQLNIAKI